MLKRVRVRIVTDREEGRGSLFEGGAVTSADKVESEHMEMTVVARYRDDGVRVSVSWQETAASGMEGSTTTITYQHTSPEIVTMLRTGTVRTSLTFERGRRHYCVYQTPIMPFEVCVATDVLENDIGGAGTLFLDYAVELRGATAERTRMRMTLLPDFDTP